MAELPPAGLVNVGYVFAGLVVSDRDRAAGWYARLIGRPADMLPNDAEAAWQLCDSASLYLLADPGRAGRGVVTLIVSELDGELARLRDCGIAGGRIEHIAGAGRKCVLTDPDGNEVALVQLHGG